MHSLLAQIDKLSALQEKVKISYVLALRAAKKAARKNDWKRASYQIERARVLRLMHDIQAEQDLVALDEVYYQTALFAEDKNKLYVSTKALVQAPSSMRTSLVNELQAQALREHLQQAGPLPA